MLVAFVTYPCLYPELVGYWTNTIFFSLLINKTVISSPSLTVLPGIWFPSTSLRYKKSPLTTAFGGNVGVLPTKSPELTFGIILFAIFKTSLFYKFLFQLNLLNFSFYKNQAWICFT